MTGNGLGRIVHGRVDASGNEQISHVEWRILGFRTIHSGCNGFAHHNDKLIGVLLYGERSSNVTLLGKNAIY